MKTTTSNTLIEEDAIETVYWNTGDGGFNGYAYNEYWYDEDELNYSYYFNSGPLYYSWSEIEPLVLMAAPDENRI